jgi:hypothetical protein
MSLPNELLREIFEYTDPFLSDYETGPGEPPTFIRRAVALIFVLRSVCRRFRAVANELSYWTDETTIFADIIPSCWTSCEDQNEAIFLKTLLADRHLARTLSNRHSWSFTDHIQLKTVLTRIPFFRKNANSISIDFPEIYPTQHIYRECLDVLKACRNLKFLEIMGGPQEVLDLISLSNSCPLLETLRLDHVEELTGILHGFCNLREFRLHDSGYNTSGHFIRSDLVFPLENGASLCSLTLIYDHIQQDEAFTAGHLDGSQLNTCIIAPFADPICEYFHRMRLENLTDFRVAVSGGLLMSGDDITVDMNRFTELLNSTSFQTLRSLSLTVIKEYSTSYFTIVDAITTNLLSLQSLVLGMGLNTSWCPNFARLVELDRLIWHVPDGEYEDPDMTPFSKNPYARYISGQVKEHSVTAIEKFTQTFQRIGRHPEIKIRVMALWNFSESIDPCSVDALLDNPTSDGWTAPWDP